MIKYNNCHFFDVFFRCQPEITACWFSAKPAKKIAKPAAFLATAHAVIHFEAVRKETEPAESVCWNGNHISAELAKKIPGPARKPAGLAMKQPADWHLLVWRWIVSPCSVTLIPLKF